MAKALLPPKHSINYTFILITNAILRSFVWKSSISNAIRRCSSCALTKTQHKQTHVHWIEEQSRRKLPLHSMFFLLFWNLGALAFSYQQDASITWCDLFCPKSAQKPPESITWHGVLEPPRQALLASRDVTISGHIKFIICGSNGRRAEGSFSHYHRGQNYYKQVFAKISFRSNSFVIITKTLFSELGKDHKNIPPKELFQGMLLL